MALNGPVSPSQGFYAFGRYRALELRPLGLWRPLEAFPASVLPPMACLASITPFGPVLACYAFLACFCLFRVSLRFFLFFRSLSRYWLFFGLLA